MFSQWNWQCQVVDRNVHAQPPSGCGTPTANALAPRPPETAPNAALSWQLPRLGVTGAPLTFLLTTPRSPALPLSPLPTQSVSTALPELELTLDADMQAAMNIGPETFCGPYDEVIEDCLGLEPGALARAARTDMPLTPPSAPESAPAPTDMAMECTPEAPETWVEEVNVAALDDLPWDTLLPDPPTDGVPSDVDPAEVARADTDPSAPTPARTPPMTLVAPTGTTADPQGLPLHALCQSITQHLHSAPGPLPDGIAQWASRLAQSSTTTRPPKATSTARTNATTLRGVRVRNVLQPGLSLLDLAWATGQTVPDLVALLTAPHTRPAAAAAIRRFLADFAATPAWLRTAFIENIRKAAAAARAMQPPPPGGQV